MSGFSEAKVKRQSAGTATGGQFAQKANSMPSIGLAPQVNAPVGESEFDRRRRELVESGYVPASAGFSRSGSVHEVERRDEWWNEAYDRAEISRDGEKTYAKMPDDWSPSRGAGRSLSGRRRTYRKLYKGPDVSVRMPSATAIRSYSEANGKQTFDIPVQAEGKGGKTVSGYVRVTEVSPGKWSTQAIGMPPKAAAKVSESVNAVLESRRPTTALAEAGDLLTRRRERFAQAGAKLEQTDNSRWIRAYGYNKQAGELVVDLGGRHYGYQVPEGAFNALKASSSAGKAYNDLVKGQPRVEVEQCQVCARWYNSARAHECGGHRPPGGRIEVYNARLRRRQERVAKRYAAPEPVAAQQVA